MVALTALEGANRELLMQSIKASRRQVRRAKPLSDEDIEQVLHTIRTTSNSPQSDELKFCLSVYAGLRAAEIAAMTVDALTDANGNVGNAIYVSAQSAKNGKGRIIPMHPRIHDAAVRLIKAYPGIEYISFSKRWYTPKKQNAHSVQAALRKIYYDAGLVGCSSHSGRRTFITRLAQVANEHGASLLDVKELAGHSSLTTTQAYIEVSANVQSLVSSL